MTDIQTAIDSVPPAIASQSAAFHRMPSPDVIQTASIDPFELIPTFVRRCLHIGAELDWLRKRCADGIDELWCASEPDTARKHIARGYFDAVLVTALPDTIEQLREWLVSLAALMGKNGRLSILFPNADIRALVVTRFDEIVLPSGLSLYAGSSDSEALRFVFASYNPIDHAHQLSELDRPDISIQILDGIPADLIVSEDLLAAIAAEKQQYYLAWQKLCADGSTHSWFSKAQREFAQATAINPDFYLPYQTLAEYWRHIGDDQTAEGILRSFQQSQSPGTNPDKRPDRPFDPGSSIGCIAPARTLPDPKILILGHSSSDYGMDTLFDGLCRVVGECNVVEYPPKPMLHGDKFDAAQNYPCTFTHASSFSSLSDIADRLEAGWFDIVLYADVVEMMHPKEVRLLLGAAANLPLIVYDTWDDCYTPLKAVLDYTGRAQVDLVFKREMLSAVDYGENTYPLPFGYPESKVHEIPPYPERQHDFFWAGKREFGLRPIILQQVEKLMRRKFDRAFDQAAYSKRIRNSQIGLSLWGYGFDTVRYWEIPAHGGMLLAQRPPIQIPHNFVNGYSAVFFDDLFELEQKLIYYLNHPEAAEKIAVQGHQHWKTYHTTEARAEQLLSLIEQRCGW